MNNTLDEETFEEINEYKLIYENTNTTIKDSALSEDIEESPLDNDEHIQEDNNLNEPISEECTALVTVKERRLLAAQTMFKKSIKVSIKSFLISLSLSFLNLFI